MWSSLGEQFLRLVIWSMHPDQPPSWGCEHPLFDLDDSAVDNVHRVAAELMDAAKSDTEIERVTTIDDAGNFFCFLARNRIAGVGAPVASLPVEDLRTLVDSSWLPSGPSGPALKNRLQQLASAVCNIRELLAGAANVLSAERRVWRLGAVVTDNDISRTLVSFGLRLDERPRVVRGPFTVTSPETLCESSVLGSTAADSEGSKASSTPLAEAAPDVSVATCHWLVSACDK